MPPMDQKRFHKFAEKFHENLWALRGDSLPRSNSLHNGKGDKTQRAPKGHKKHKGLAPIPLFMFLLCSFSCLLCSLPFHCCITHITLTYSRCQASGPRDRIKSLRETPDKTLTGCGKPFQVLQMR